MCQEKTFKFSTLHLGTNDEKFSLFCIKHYFTVFHPNGDAFKTIPELIQGVIIIRCGQRNVDVCVICVKGDDPSCDFG